MKKMSEETKVKLFYSGELIVIAIVFFVIATLRMVGIIKYDETRRIIFNFITTAGGIWFTIDLFWTLFNKQRRKKQCLLDKFLNLPLAIFLLVFNIICFTNPLMKESFYTVMISLAFFYVSIDYSFQGVYHFFKPIPMLEIELEKERQEKLEEENKSKEEVK